MSNWLEVRIPISPLEHYFNRIQLIACSIRSLGGRYADVRVRVTVGADQEPEDLYARLPWSRAAGVDWVWVDRKDFNHWKHTQHEYIATMMERFRPPFSTQQVLMLDADVLVMREFDELSALLDSQPGIAGVMAHASPFLALEEQGHLHSWQQLFECTGLSTPPFTHEHSGWGIMDHSPVRRFAPPYFNTGVVLGTASILETLYAPYMRALNSVRSIMDSYFFEQIALTLALFDTGIPVHVLPLRYNYPNQPEFDAARPGELEAIRFLHFLRTKIVQREADFATLETIEKMTARADLAGSNELFRRRVAELLPSLAAARTYSNKQNMN